MMIVYHAGVPIQPSVTQYGFAYVARASVIEEDGEATSFGMLGVFASEDAALTFAIRSASAFVDGESLPKPPYEPLPPKSVSEVDNTAAGQRRG
ncbi:hypothetical protein [Paraburkholderia sp. D15]|uniref:hypothetical protein n=1 Tax=Paraburkholderia sp. D15 TaxID=2880218 RepID=UPI0032B02AE9